MRDASYSYGPTQPTAGAVRRNTVDDLAHSFDKIAIIIVHTVEKLLMASLFQEFSKAADCPYHTSLSHIYFENYLGRCVCSSH